MNERLLELARQAKIEFTYDPTETPMRAFAECWEDELAKFAELIVKECANIAYGYDAPKMSGLGMIIAGRIESHFGVEE